MLVLSLWLFYRRSHYLDVLRVPGRPLLAGLVLAATVLLFAWGVYTLRGRGSANPLADTAYNFVRTLPIVAVLALPLLPLVQFSNQGVLLAILSGALASGVGYTIWYAALGGLSVTQAAVVQLAVPLIAALGGVVFSAELISGRLVVAACLILGGILLVTLAQRAGRGD